MVLVDEYEPSTVCYFYHGLYWHGLCFLLCILNGSLILVQAPILLLLLKEPCALFLFLKFDLSLLRGIIYTEY